MQYRLVQPDGASRQLARRASDGSADCPRGRTRVGVELPVAEDLRRERLPGSQVHRIQRLLQSRSGRPVAVHVRRSARASTAAAAAAGFSTTTGAATRYRSRSRSTRRSSAGTRSSSALEIERSHVRDVGAAVRAGRLLHLRLRRGSVLPNTATDTTSRATTSARPRSCRISGPPGS